MNPSDRIILSGIECRVHLGVPDSERKRRQKVLIDVELEADAAKAARTDDPSKAVDYWAVEKAVRAAAESTPRRLLETLAEHAAAAVLSADSRIRAVRVRARKYPAVMPRTREVAVEIVRIYGGIAAFAKPV